MRQKFPILSPAAILVLLFASALLLNVWIYGDWFQLQTIPETPTHDLSKHVSIALTFREAIAAGQWLPRTQARDGFLGDVPVYQYYGFLEGLIAWPFLLLGVPGLDAVTAGIIALRWGAFAMIYATCRLWKAGPPSSALAGFAYLLSPYLISNVLCRFAIAEAHAHSLLPLFFLSATLIHLRRRLAGISLMALLFLALALAHNIFFLYGALLLAILMAVCLPDWRSALALGVGGGIGMFAAAPQWYPALASKNDFTWKFYDIFNPYFSSQATSLSGLIGWLKPYCSLVEGGGKDYYLFTFGWWTLPAFAGLLYRCRRPEQRPRALGLLLAGVFFCFLTKPPFDVWAWLPGPFAAVQFPYRLIAFASLAAALGIAVAWPRLSWAGAGAIVLVMIGSQWTAFRTNNLHPGSLADEAVLAPRIVALDYRCQASDAALSATPRLCQYNGLLAPNNLIKVAGLVGKLKHPALFVAGVNLADAPIAMRLANSLANPPSSGSSEGWVLVPPGDFSIALPLASGAVGQTILCVPSPGATQWPPVLLQGVRLQEEQAPLLVAGNQLETLERHGYTRRFRVPPPDHPGDVYIHLPVDYNRFWQVLLDGKPIATTSDLIQQLCVRMQGSGVLTVRYHLPWLCWAMAAAGLAVWAAQPWLWRKLDEAR